MIYKVSLINHGTRNYGTEVHTIEADGYVYVANGRALRFYKLNDLGDKRGEPNGKPLTIFKKLNDLGNKRVGPNGNPPPGTIFVALYSLAAIESVFPTDD